MTSAPIRPIEVPPFQLQPLISSIPTPPPSKHTPSSSRDFDISKLATDGPLSGLASGQLFSRVMGGGSNPSRTPTSSSETLKQTTAREIRCLEAYNKDIYVGCSDGTLIRYSVRDDTVTSGDLYSVASQQSVPGNKSVDKITLLPSISKALVLSGNIMHFYTLPALDPLPATVVSPLRAVVTFAVDEAAVGAASNLPPNQAPPPVRICVVRRRAIAVYSLRDRLAPVKDIPFPNGALLARLTGAHLCLADQASYHMINIDAVEALELMEYAQAPPLDPNVPVRPLIVVSDTSEFMLVNWVGNGSLGFFMTTTGDPVRGTLEYPAHPLSICVDYPYVAALLPNSTIEIHSLATLSIVAVIQCPTTLEASFLSYSIGGYLLPSIQRNTATKLVSVPLLKPATPEATTPDAKLGPPSGSGLTPPPSPGPPPSLSRSVSGRSTRSASASSLTRTSTLVSGIRGVHSLLPTTLVSQIDSLLSSARVDDAMELLAQTRGKADKSGAAVDEGFVLEVQLISQQIAYELVSLTRFEDAVKYLLDGNVDPRILIRLFPDLRGGMVNPADEISVFSGVADRVVRFDSIDAIVRNYHPHIKPSVEEATPTAELRRVLNAKAREMLLAYLRKIRSKVPGLAEGATEVVKLKRMVDTVLLKIFLEEEDFKRVTTLVENSDDLIISEIEPLLIQQSRFGILSRIYERKGDEAKLLEIWAKVADGEWKDPTMPHPLPGIVSLLTESKDRTLVQRYGIWLVKHDAAAALQLFIAKDAKRGMKLDEALILRAIRASDADLGQRYLEHLVMYGKASDTSLHNQLIATYLDRLLSSLKEPSVVELWKDILATYASQPSSSDILSIPSSPFLTHLSSLPNSAHVVTRVKLALFLQGSSSFDYASVVNRLEKDDKEGIFSLERAIIYGKTGNHQAALTLLVRSLNDTTTAEAYCTLGGEVIPVKVALLVAHNMGIEPWGQLVASTGVASGSGFGNARTRQQSLKAPVSEEKKKELLGILMKVYMQGGDGTSEATAQLLNAQAMNLDVLDVLSAVPPAWSLNVISSFLERSFRRSLHERHEGLITKAIASSQNLDVNDTALEAFREEGAVIEEPADASDSGDELNEKRGLDDDEEVVSEKVELYQTPPTGPQPIAIPPRTPRAPGLGSVDSSRTMS